MKLDYPNINENLKWLDVDSEICRITFQGKLAVGFLIDSHIEKIGIFNNCGIPQFSCSHFRKLTKEEIESLTVYEGSDEIDINSLREDIGHYSEARGNDYTLSVPDGYTDTDGDVWNLLLVIKDKNEFVIVDAYNKDPEDDTCPWNDCIQVDKLTEDMM